MHRILLTLLFVPLVGCGAGEPCEYNGEMLSDGDSLHSEDGCNYCTCNDGVVTCICLLYTSDAADDP